MIYFIDQTSEKSHHAVFNSSIIKALLLLYPDNELQYYGIKSNQESVLSILNNDGIKKINLNSIKYSKSRFENKYLKLFNFIKKEYKRYKIFKTILKNSNKTDVIFLSITTFTSFYLFKKLKQKYDVKVICALHGDIDFIYNYDSFFEKINGIVHKKIFKIDAPNFYYLTLNKIAKKYMVDDGFLKNEEVLEINHPFISNTISAINNFTNADKPLTIGHIGSMEVARKNSHLLYQIAEKFENEINHNQIIFNTIGLITPPVLEYKNKFVNEIIGNTKPNKPDYLTREEYENNVLKLDFIVFFYDIKNYIFRASGAVIDAIAFEIPIIVFKHPFFDSLFEQFGPIGYSCNSIDEVEKLIKDLSIKSNARLQEYKFFKENISKLRQEFTIDAIVKDIQNQFLEL